MEQALQEALWRQIPLSRAMDLRVVEAGGRVRLGAPLAPNLNHQQTAFGGSLYCAAVLAGWSWLWVRRGRLDLGGALVVRASTARYLRPVSSAFTAVCPGPEAGDWERFLGRYSRRGRASLELPVTIEESGLEALRFRGEFALLR